MSDLAKGIFMRKMLSIEGGCHCEGLKLVISMDIMLPEGLDSGWK